jgi:hypothetical protein
MQNLFSCTTKYVASNYLSNLNEHFVFHIVQAAYNSICFYDLQYHHAKTLSYRSTYITVKLTHIPPERLVCENEHKYQSMQNSIHYPELSLSPRSIYECIYILSATNRSTVQVTIHLVNYLVRYVFGQSDNYLGIQFDIWLISHIITLPAS